MVSIKINSVPPGARVVNDADGAILGRTPYSDLRATSDGVLRLKLEIEGFNQRSVEVPLRADFEGSFELERHRAHSKEPHHAVPVTVPAAAVGSPIAPAPPEPAPKKKAPNPEPIEWK